jgi:hypothetical protein
MTLDELANASVATVSRLDVIVLHDLQQHVALQSNFTKRLQTVLDSALEARYAQGLNGAGTAHRADGGFDVKITAPKKVVWDKELLADLAVDNDVSEYIDWTPAVSETRYKGAPNKVQALLNGARSEGIGKVKIEINRKED